MAHPPDLPPTLPELPTAPDDLTSAYRWFFEMAAAWVRWADIILTLVLIPLFPQVFPPFVVLWAVGLAGGNAAIARLLRQRFRPERQRRVSRMAAGLEWAAGLAGISLFALVPESNAEAVLLVLVLFTGLRFGRRGLVLATVGAEIIVGLVVMAQMLVSQVVDPETAGRQWASWTAYVLLMALAVAGLLHAAQQWHRWQEIQWIQERADLRRLEYRLSVREWELLPLLARADLTYEQIGQLLDRSPETIRSHVGRIGTKLGVSGGRVSLSMASISSAGASEPSWA